MSIFHNFSEFLLNFFHNVNLQSVTYIIDTHYISMKDLLKDTPTSWFNVAPILEKLCHAVVVRNEQTNLQLT